MSTELFSTLPYKVADITLADFGRKEIDLAEKEMPEYDGSSRKVWRIQTVKRCPHYGVVAHDHSNGCAD